ncbi:PREDICTED: superoxide dismutase [Cu-Zn] 2-like isoform 2 [Fragaria vesca subsp. vesca]
MVLEALLSSCRRVAHMSRPMSEEESWASLPAFTASISTLLVIPPTAAFLPVPFFLSVPFPFWCSQFPFWCSQFQFRCSIPLGPHFNPLNKDHGAPSDQHRHAGDLGNVTAGPDGVAEVSLVDSQIPLSGPHSILGRAVVVHADPDDLGKVKGGEDVRFCLIRLQ